MDSTSAPDEDICSRCGEGPATNHICYGGTGESLDLCDDCMAAEDPLSASFAIEAKSANCEYCGGSPCGGGPDTFAQLGGGPMKNKWMCMTCAPEYYEFIQRELAKIPKDIDSAQQIAAMQDVSRSAEIHMRKFTQNPGS